MPVPVSVKLSVSVLSEEGLTVQLYTTIRRHATTPTHSYDSRLAICRIHRQAPAPTPIQCSDLTTETDTDNCLRPG